MQTPDIQQTYDTQSPFTVENEHGGAPVLILCDHASKHIPPALDGLGLPPEQLSRHIAWDIGAAEVSRQLAGLLDAPAILCGTSRLVIDCNRPFWADTSIPPHSDGVPIPGNAQLDQAECQRRIEHYFHPYHNEIARRIQVQLRNEEPLALVSIHSFTPVMDGFERPWHVGMLWDRDDRLAAPLVQKLRQDPDLCVGENKPYDGSNPPGYALHTHAADNNLPMAVFEIRQDLIDTDEGAGRWAHILTEALIPVLAAHGR